MVPCSDSTAPIAASVFHPSRQPGCSRSSRRAAPAYARSTRASTPVDAAVASIQAPSGSWATGT